MGDKKRRHAAKVLARNEKAREQVSGVAVATLQKQSTNKQIKFLSEALSTGHLSMRKLRKELEWNANKEMRKGAEKLIKKGKTPTVDLLMVDYWKESEFRVLAKRVGLDETWFIELAEAECQRWRVKV